MGKPKAPAVGARRGAAKGGRAQGGTGPDSRGPAARGVARGGHAHASAEAVVLGLGAAVDLAEFQHEMLAGFDRLMTTGGLSPVEGEEAVLDGFRARPTR